MKIARSMRAYFLRTMIPVGIGFVILAVLGMVIGPSWLQVAASILLVCLAVCFFVWRWMVQQIAGQLTNIRHQIECLKHYESGACLLPGKIKWQEVGALSDAVVALRDHLDSTKISKESLHRTQQWHWAMLSGLLAGLRHQLDAHSPLLEPLNDYALLLQSARGDALPPAKSFDLVHIVNASASAVRKQHMKLALVNVTASVQAGTKREWVGQPEMLETLLRHMLLIGTTRTQTGFVYVRVQGLSDSSLHLIYEDSGPAIQPWQLQQWLGVPQHEMPDMHTHMSWLMVTWLFARLGGKVTGRSLAQGGLVLEGTIPLVQASDQAAMHPALQPLALPISPVLLVVEKDDGKLSRALVQVGCRVFTVPTHAMALEWAAALPFSAIVMNDTFSDAKDVAIQRLGHMQEEGILPDIPYWMVTANHAFIETDYWRARGVTQLLFFPISLPVLQQACAQLAEADRQFYMQYDARIQADFATTLQDALPQMADMLIAQAEQFYSCLQLQLRQPGTQDIAAQAHKVKSAALSLGYFHLAALMGQIEHHAGDRRFAPANWEVIADCLREFLEMCSPTALPNAA